MVLNFISSFRDIVYHILTLDKTDNQILSDLHLLSEEIRGYISGINSKENILNDSSLAFTKSIEYNNALLLTALHPANIKYFLNSALIEKRYYFFSTVCDMLLNSNLKKEYKKEVLSVYEEASVKLKISLLFQESEISELIIQICDEILSISMINNNWKAVAINYIEGKLKVTLPVFFNDDNNLSENILAILVSSLEKY